MKNFFIRMICYFSVISMPFKSRVKFLYDENMVQYILKNQLSLIRLGDGEYNLLLKKSGIKYQKYNKELHKEMQQFMKEYKTKENQKYLIAVPYLPFSNGIKWYIKNDKKFLMCFGIYRFYFRITANKNKMYGDAMLFREGNKKTYEQLWKNNSDFIIFVHNNEKYAKKFYNEYKIHTYFVKVPNQDSYDKIDEIEKEIVEKVEELKNKKVRVLISAGPMAKVLVYRLSRNKIIAYDCGHCWDEPLII